MTAPPAVASLLGVEQEFELYARGEKVDFRDLFPAVLSGTRAVHFRNLAHAVLTEEGYVLSCDEEEAEFSTAPVHLSEGVEALVAETVRCREHLLDLLFAAGVEEVRGYSTHLSVSLPGALVAGSAWQTAYTAGPALVLMIEAKSSPGLLLRPRRERLELAAEYVDDSAQLSALIAFFAGATASWAALGHRYSPTFRVRRWARGYQRGGIYLPPDAYGPSIHRYGRHTWLERMDGGRARAQDVLETYADHALAALGPRVNGAGDALRRAVATFGALQIDRDPERVAAVRRRRPAAAPPRLATSFGRILSDGRALGLAPRFVDWLGAVFELVGLGAYVGCPRGRLGELMDRVRAQGVGWLLALPLQPVLTRLAQLGDLALFAEIDPVALGIEADSDTGGKKGKKKR